MRLGLGVGIPMPAGVGVAPFSPLALNPVLWLDASDTSTITAADGAWLDGTGLQLPGTTGNYASAPDSAALSITGDIEIVVRAAFDEWNRPDSPTTEPRFVDKLGGTFAGYRFDWQTSTDRPRLLWGNGSTYIVVAANADPSFVDGTPYWLKVVLDVDNGSSQYEVKFYTAPDAASEPGSWTQLGTTAVGGAVTAITDNTSPLLVGEFSSGAGTSGSVYRTIIRDGIGGTTVFDADFTAEPAGTLSFTEDSTNAATVSLTTTYGQTSQWDDKSGNGYHVTQGTAAKQPTSGTRTLNGANVLDFDGTSDAMASGTFASALSARTVFVVGQLDSVASGVNHYFTDGNAASNRNVIGSVSLNWGIHSGIAILGGTADANAHVFRAVFDATDTLHVDGSQVVSGDAGSNTIQGLSIGAYPTLTTAYLDGTIAEIIVVDGTLTADQIAATESYLAAKWGITI